MEMTSLIQLEGPGGLGFSIVVGAGAQKGARGEKWGQDPSTILSRASAGRGGETRPAAGGGCGVDGFFYFYCWFI